ncbi:NUDIX hydrolase [Paenibacillus tyrfis]|nr:NUDIX hydrolase [Paenibacillus tyrfis]
MKRVNVASAVITDDNGNLLIVHNTRGDSTYWSLPGGAVEEGETLEQAVLREVKEETGYDIAVTGLSSLREVLFTERGNHALVVTFFAKVIGGEMGIHDPDQDILEVRWVDLQTARELMPALMEQLKINSATSPSPAFYAFEGQV